MYLKILKIIIGEIFCKLFNVRTKESINQRKLEGKKGGNLQLLKNRSITSFYSFVIKFSGKNFCVIINSLCEEEIRLKF